MYEDLTYENILNRMLERVPSAVDKREGSIIYDALAPAAAELAQTYIEMEIFLQESFAVSASQQYLLKRAAEVGLYPDQATKAMMKGEFNIDIPIGSRFSCEDLNYVAIEQLEQGIYKMQCETPGQAGSRRFGKLIPIEYINGLTKAELTEVISYGQDEENTEHFREKYLLRVQKPATSGNVHDYEQWALEVPGVGKSRVIPLWNGAGTVKIMVIDTDLQPASEALLTDTLEHIEEVRPIGAEVSVVAPTAKPISVSVTISKTASAYLADIKNGFVTRLKDFFKRITFVNNYVSYAIIGSLLLDVPGVIDYTDLKINGAETNIKIEYDEVPILGTVEVAV